MHVMDLKKIDTLGLNRMMFDQIIDLEREGYVDYNFRQCQSLKDDSGVSFFLDVIVVFLAEADIEVQNLAKLMKPPGWDFNEMRTHYIKLKGSSSCIGACQLRDSCRRLGDAIDNQSRDGCLEALKSVTHDFMTLQKRLDIVIKIEQEIVARETK